MEFEAEKDDDVRVSVWQAAVFLEEEVHHDWRVFW